MALCYGCPRTRRQPLGQQRSTGRGSKCPVWQLAWALGVQWPRGALKPGKESSRKYSNSIASSAAAAAVHTVPSARTFSPRLYLGSDPPPLGRQSPKALSFLGRFLLLASLRLVLLLPSYGGCHLGKVPQLPASPDTRTPICSRALLLPTCWPPPRFLLPGSDTAPAPGRKDPNMPSMLPPSLP